MKNETAFKAWAKSINLGVWQQGLRGIKRFGIYVEDCNEEGWPACVLDEETGESTSICIEDEVSKHLQEGSVAVLLEAGAEKLTYVVGRAIAVNSKGETVEISLRDIYQAAKHLGDDMTSAED